MVSPRKPSFHHHHHVTASASASSSTTTSISTSTKVHGVPRSTRPRASAAAAATASFAAVSTAVGSHTNGPAAAAVMKLENLVSVPPANSKPRKSVRYVFSKKKFYLDLKTRSVTGAKIRQLIEDIQLLGGTIEEFFSKDVTTVISDAPEWKLRNPTGAPDVVSPGTPCSLSAIANSPWSPATPVEDNNKKGLAAGGGGPARSRVDTILERARQQAKGTSDVIENAHRWGLKVWSLHKILSWLESFKQQVGPLRKTTASSSTSNVAADGRRTAYHHTRSQSVDSSLCQQRSLVAPYIKFEVNNHQYKPVHQEFKKFPRLHLGGRAGTSPFYGPDSSRSKMSRRILKEDYRDRHNTKKRQPSPRSRETAAAAAAAAAARKQQSGYCEICETQFEDLDKHLETSAHRHVIAVSSYWAKLDLCIGLVNMNSDDSVVELSDGRS